MIKIKFAAIKFYNLDTNCWQIITAKNHALCFTKMYEKILNTINRHTNKGLLLLKVTHILLAELPLVT